MNIRAHLGSLPAYTPIEPFEVLSARLGREPSEIVKLDANENPYGPLPVVREALGKLDFPHLSDPESRLLQVLSKFTASKNTCLQATSGRADDLLMRALLEPGDCILSATTFGMYCST
jgi:histidinol-phosphate aminotransferase